MREIYEFIKDDDLKSALSTFEIQARDEKPYLNELRMLTARHERVNTQFRQNIISRDDFELEKNKISKAVIELAERFEDKEKNFRQKFFNYSRSNSLMGILFIVIVTIFAMKYYSSSLTSEEKVVDNSSYEIRSTHEPNISTLIEILNFRTILIDSVLTKNEFYEVRQSFEKLHKQNIKAISNGNYMLSHEITRNINILLYKTNQIVGENLFLDEEVYYDHTKKIIRITIPIDCVDTIYPYLHEEIRNDLTREIILRDSTPH